MSPRALVLEPSVAVSEVLGGFLAGAGWDVQVSRSAAEAMATLALDSVDVVFAGVSPGVDAEAFCRARREAAPYGPLALVFPPDEAAADVRAQKAGADGCLQGPLKAGPVVSLARLLAELGRLRAMAAGQALPPQRAFTIPSGRPELEFFQRQVQLELKRAYRHRYAVTVVALGLDFPKEAGQAGVIAESLSQAARVELAAAIRDTDVVVEADGGHFLILLTYTSGDGAVGVAERLRSRLFGLHETFVTASAGLAEVDATTAAAQTAEKFLDAAVTALARAQAAGGDRLERAK